MKLPESLLQSLNGVPGFDREPFVAVHGSGEQVTSIRANAAKLKAGSDAKALLTDQPSWPPSANLSQVPWCETGRYLSQRPFFTFDPLFHAGCYYVQEASSMFLEQAFRQLLPLSEPLKILDLCAAPGGKSTHIQSLLSPQSVLVSNEVIRARANVLVDNVVKWGASNVIVTANDPKAFQKTTGYFDAMVVDAPCSGSGLFRKDPDAVAEWSPGSVVLCSGRQRRILADALPALKDGGLLIYSTCSYSAEENEAIADWLVTEMSMESSDLTIADDSVVRTASSATGAEGFRFYPDKLEGEGFFLACFRKTGVAASPRLKPAKAEQVSVREKETISRWLQAESFRLLRVGEDVAAMPPHIAEAYLELRDVLSVQYAGIKAGTLLRDKFIPHHALAHTLTVSADVSVAHLDYDDAVLYLQRQDLKITTSKTGWHLIQYKGYNLGWVNALGSRINNYYPKELRILKARPHTFFPDL